MPPRSDSPAGSPRPRGLIAILIAAARDLWQDSFLLMVLNFVFAVSAIPGMLLVWHGVIGRQVVVAAAGVATLAVWPYTTFGLFHTAGRVVAGEAIHLRTFVRGGRRRLGPAYRWAALNLIVLTVLTVNVFFYLDPRAPLSGTAVGGFLAGVFFLLGVIWIAGQPLLLATFPVLEIRSLRQAGAAMARLIARRPLSLLGSGLICALLFVAGIAVLPLGLALAFSAAAVLACRAVADLGGTPATGTESER